MQQYPETDHFSDVDLYDDEEPNYHEYSQTEFMDDPSMLRMTRTHKSRQ